MVVEMSTETRTAVVLAAATATASNTGPATASTTSNAAGRAYFEMKSIVALVVVGVVAVLAL